MDEVRAKPRVEEGQPEHIAVDRKLCGADGNGDRAREVPEYDGKCAERRQLLEDADEQRQRERYELIDVLADTLVGVVRVAAQDLQAVVDLSVHPARQVLLRHPCTPVDCQHLTEIDGVDGNDNIDEREARELTDERPERCPVIRLQCVVEDAVPVIDPHKQIDHHKIERDDRGEQTTCFPFFGRTPISFEQPPEAAQER